MPEINGSTSGFIALVVILSIFVVICCAITFWLLKYHEPSREDHVRRKTERDGARARQSQIPLNPRSVGARISRAFGRSGWERTYDDDEEEEEGRHEVEWYRGQNPFEPLTGRGHQSRHAEVAQHIGSIGVGADGISHSQSPSTSTVELSAHSTSTPLKVEYSSGANIAMPSPPSSISFSPSSEMRQHRISLSSMSAEIVDYDYEHLHEQGFSVQSQDSHFGAVPMTKWENGTKFKEDIS